MGEKALALAMRAQLIVQSLSCTNPLSFKDQMYVLKHVAPRLFGFFQSCLWLPSLSFHSGSHTPKYVWSGTFSTSGATFTFTVAW